MVEDSGLRGCGGAGYVSERKWHFAAAAKAERHYVICNADEGEPGTFKDRVVLTERADLVFEGMTIAARAINAREGILYLRGEYLYLRDHLESVLAAGGHAARWAPASWASRASISTSASRWAPAPISAAKKAR